MPLLIAWKDVVITETQTGEVDSSITCRLTHKLTGVFVEGTSPKRGPQRRKLFDKLHDAVEKYIDAQEPRVAVPRPLFMSMRDVHGKLDSIIKKDAAGEQPKLVDLIQLTTNIVRLGDVLNELLASQPNSGIACLNAESESKVLGGSIITN
jgi:hypothetical protein